LFYLKTKKALEAYLYALMCYRFGIPYLDIPIYLSVHLTVHPSVYLSAFI